MTQGLGGSGHWRAVPYAWECAPGAKRGSTAGCMCKTTNSQPFRFATYHPAASHIPTAILQIPFCKPYSLCVETIAPKTPGKLASGRLAVEARQTWPSLWFKATNTMHVLIHMHLQARTRTHSVQCLLSSSLQKISVCVVCDPFQRYKRLRHHSAAPPLWLWLRLLAKTNPRCCLWFHINRLHHAGVGR